MVQQSSWKEAWNFDSRKPDYPAWKIRIRTLLQAENVWVIATRQLVFCNEWRIEDQDDFIRRDKRAIHLLISSLDNATVKAVGKYDRSWLILEHLERVYAGSGTVNLARARREFNSITYEDGGDMQSHINELEDKAEVLARLMRPVDNDEKCLQLLESLPETWANLVMICQSQDLSWQSVQEKLLLEYDRRKSIRPARSSVQAHTASSGVEAQALIATNAPESNRPSKKPRLNQQRSDTHKYAKVKACFYCGDKNHLRNSCEMKARHDLERAKREQPTANVVESQEAGDGNGAVKWAAVTIGSSEPRAALQTGSTDHGQIGNKFWVLDSGATHHMTSDSSYFRQLTGVQDSVSLGDNSELQVKGVGVANVNFTSENGRMVTLELSNCFYVPSLAKNLLSVRQLRKKLILSDMNTYEDKAAISKDGVKIWSTAVPGVALYLFEHKPTNTTDVCAYVGVGNVDIELWHARLGHLGYQNIAKLVSGGKAQGINVPRQQLSNFPACDECTRANQQRASFKHANTAHAIRANELVYTDIKGPLETESLGGKRYVLLFVDDWSGYMTIYLLRQKSEALSRFKEYVKSATTKQDRPVGAVNSDNGGEFTSPSWV